MAMPEVIDEADCEGDIPAEFKVAAVLLIDAGRRPAEVAREIGVVKQTLHNWPKAHREGRLSNGQGVKVTPEPMEIARLRAEVGRLKMEADILKKAAAYFARQSL
jgi:transposase